MNTEPKKEGPVGPAAIKEMKQEISTPGNMGGMRGGRGGGRGGRGGFNNQMANRRDSPAPGGSRGRFGFEIGLCRLFQFSLHEIILSFE
jgi:hypothetical protein